MVTVSILHLHGQLPGKAGEIFRTSQCARAVTVTIGGKGVDEVEIGAEIERFAAEFAEGKNDQPDGDAFGCAQLPVAGGKFGFQCLECELQALLGQTGASGQGVLDIVQMQGITPDQAGGFSLTIVAQ